MEADRLGKALNSIWPLELSWVIPELADTLPWVLAVFIRIIEPGDRVVRKLLCLPCALVVRLKLSVYSSDSVSVGWYSKVAPGAMPMGGMKRPGTWL
jgi:hypothetical protein